MNRSRCQRPVEDVQTAVEGSEVRTEQVPIVISSETVKQLSVLEDMVIYH